MPLPRGLARFNRHVTNRVAYPLSTRMKPFALVRHEGRSSGKAFETPVWAWRHGEVVTVALTYGADVDWLKNLQKTGGGGLVMTGDELSVGEPRLIDTEVGMARMPRVVETALRLLDVTEFVEFPVNPTS